MAITTQDCKDFIDINQVNLSSSNNKWKRIRKYKDNGYILRDFQNEDGMTLTIAEKNDVLSIYAISNSSLLKNNVVSKYGVTNGFKYLGKKSTLKDLQEFMAECIKESVAIHTNSDERLVYDDDYIIAEKENQWDLDWSEKVNNEEVIDDEYQWDLRLIYSDNEIELEDVYKVHSLFMPRFDTAYRYMVFETHDNHLLLGCNNPD